MSWNIVPECISTAMLLIIWTYSRKGNPIPSLKNKIFQACFLTTFCAMTSNIASTLLLYHLNEFTLIPAWIITSFYFIATPLMGMVYFYYVLANIYENTQSDSAENHHSYKKVFLLNSIPGFIYIAIILLNPVTHNVFSISLKDGYVQEKYLMLTYIIFYLYCIACVFMVIFKGGSVQTSIRIILFSFPLIAAFLIIIQLFYPSIMLSGAAATCALLLIYLYVQNKQISIDYLTGIPNRQEFLSMLELKLKKAPHAKLAIIILSLTEFKMVNDTYGQHNGDAFIVAVCDYLKKDIAPDRNQIYRYSGDEFAMLLENMKEDGANEIVQNMSKRMLQPWTTKECTSLLSGAIGVVWYPDTADKMESLINGIEYSIALAKSDHVHNHICYCTPDILEKAKRRQLIITILKECLENDGFSISYQPIYSVASKKFVMAEALLRLPKSQLGPLSPGEFIPIAEKSGLIIPITYWVLDQVCKNIRQFMDHNIDLDVININFSAIQFTQKDLIPKMKEIIERNHVPYSKIKIEITESVLAESSQVVTSFINHMHELGIRIGLDDFGTGFSNLTTVIETLIDTIKLDKSLVWSAMKSMRSSIVVENLTRAFRELDMIVLAEGVETEEQSQFVENCGCHLIQGFLYAKPMPTEEFEAFMTTRRSEEPSPAEI